MNTDNSRNELNKKMTYQSPKFSVFGSIANITKNNNNKPPLVMDEPTMCDHVGDGTAAPFCSS